MARFANVSYGQKILGLAALTSSVAVTLVCSVLIYVEYTDAQQRAVGELETNAQLIATHSAAAMVFGDVQAGVETLAALQVVDEIRSACIFDLAGEHFACYENVSESLPVIGDVGEGARIHDGILRLSYPIDHDGETLGSLALHYDMSSVYERLTSRVFIAAGVGVFALVMSLALAEMLRRKLTLPVNELVKTARRASEEDYSVRAQRYADDELGTLTNAFNHMLDQIEERDNDLRESRGRLAIAQRMARLGYWTWNIVTDEFVMSEELATVCNLKEDQKIESLQQFAAMIEDVDRETFDSDVNRAVEARVAVNAHYRLRPGVGTLLHVHQQLNVECVADKPVAIAATVQDVTAQRMAEEEVRRLAYYDALTGLASRRYLYQRIGELIKSARRRQTGFALFFMDLDGFKDVNDSLGHDEGDVLLKTIAERLKKSLRETDFLARLGGDEFCMLIDDVSDEMYIGQIATRCLNSVEAKVDLRASSVRPRVSIGISRFPEDGEDTHALLRSADSAMYAAKESGRHRFEFFDQAMTLRAGERLALAQELRTALVNEEFELYYQPQIALSSGAIVGYEALVRWNHPTKGMVPPNDFIPEMERLGIVNDLGNWVIQEACQQIVRWRKEGICDVRISVNIAPTHFQSSNLVKIVEDALRTTGVEPQWLELEITETSIQYTDQILAVLKKLRAIGVCIAIDDFGSGYSSLGSLQHLPVDCLKIDRVFVSDLLTNPKDAVLLGTIMTLSHALDFRVVAEGVEELKQIQILRSLGCDLVQGFYFSRPVPANEIPALAKQSFLPELAPAIQLASSKVH